MLLASMEASLVVMSRVPFHPRTDVCTCTRQTCKEKYKNGKGQKQTNMEQKAIVWAQPKRFGPDPCPYLYAQWHRILITG